MDDILSKNLAAMQSWTPAAATLLAAAPMPDGFSRTTGADGSPTYHRVIDQPPRHVEYLGGTSLPRSAAPSLTADMDPGNSAALALGIGSGHEWPALLARMNAHQALFVYDTDLPTVRMALDVVDLTTHLSSGRLVLLLGEAAGDQLSAFLRANPGFDVPIVLQQLPSLAPDRRNALRAAAETMIRRAVAERTQLGSQILIRLSDYAPSPRSAIVAFPATPQYLGQRLLWVALHAASTKREIVALPADHHASSSLLARLDAIAHYRPSTIQADFFRTRLGGGIPQTISIHAWVPPLAPHAYFAPDRLPAPASLAPTDRIIVHSSEHVALFESLGFPKNAVHLVPIALAPNELPAANHTPSPGTAIPGPAHAEDSTPPLTLRASVALIGDLFPLHPAAYGFELPSHQSIWEAARSLLESDLRDNSLPLAHRTADLLQRAGVPKANVTLAEAHISEGLLRAFRHALLRTVTLITLARKLADAGIPLKLIGRNWHLGGGAGLADRAVITPFSRCPRDLFSGVAVTLHADPAAIFDPLHLAAAASGSGSALVSIDHPHAGRPGNIATLLAPDTDFQPTSLKNLLPTLRSLLQESPRRAQLAASAHQTITTKHLWSHRGLNL